MGNNNVVSCYPKSTGIPQVDGLSTRPSEIGASHVNLFHLFFYLIKGFNSFKIY